MKKEQDIKELIWAYETFQQCIPKENRSNISMLVGKYYINHPTDETIQKIGQMTVDLINTERPKKGVKEINFVKYIKEHYND